LVGGGRSWGTTEGKRGKGAVKRRSSYSLHWKEKFSWHGSGAKKRVKDKRKKDQKQGEGCWNYHSHSHSSVWYREKEKNGEEKEQALREEQNPISM